MPEAVALGDAALLLRPWRASDLADLLAHANHAEVVRGLSSGFPHPYTEADGRAFLSGQVVPLARWTLAICRDGIACGGIAITPGLGERSGSAPAWATGWARRTGTRASWATCWRCTCLG